MIPIEESPPPIGDNNPPSLIEELVAETRDAVKEFEPRIAEVIERITGKEVIDTIAAGEAGDLLKIADQLRKLVDEERKRRTNPYRQAADGAKAVVDRVLDPLDEAMDVLRARLRAWTSEEKQRAEKQRAEQAAILGDAAKPPVDISAKPVPVRKPKKVIAVGDLGAKVTQEIVKNYEVTDVSKVPAYILETDTVKAAIVQVAKAMSRHIPDIPGINITETTSNRIR